MKSTIQYKVLSFLVFLIFFGYSSAFAQFSLYPGQTQQNSQYSAGQFRQNPPDSTQLPTLDQRAEDLKNAGVPQDLINQQVLPNTGSPSNPIQQPLPSQVAAPNPDSLVDIQNPSKKPTRPSSQMQSELQEVGTDMPVLYRYGDNVKLMTLYNTTKSQVDTFRTYNEWMARYLEEEKQRTQEAYDKALKSRNTLYGHHIFIKKDFTRSDTSAYSPPESYVVQTGDKFLIQVTGAAELFEYLEVDKDGTVFRQFMGKKVVAGTTYSQARKTIENGYAKIVPKGTTIIISLVKNKSMISVNVTGEVQEPGTYTLPNITNAISAIYAAKGIRELGSVRTIYIKREGKTVKTIDLYDYLVNGNTEQIYLKNNDFIFVPMRKNVVMIDGEVKRPMRYELKENETISDLIHYAGGLTRNAAKGYGQIERIENGKDGVIDVNLTANGNKKLDDDDIVHIRSAYFKRDGIAQITGSVKYAGTYDWQKGKRVKDLIDKAGGLLPEAYLDRAYVVRIPKAGEIKYIPISLKDLKDTTQNIRIEYLDQLIIFNDQAFNKKPRYIIVSGEVKKPGIYRKPADMSLKNLIFIAGGFTEDADLTDVELAQYGGAPEMFNERIQKALIAESELNNNVFQQENDPAGKITKKGRDTEIPSREVRRLQKELEEDAHITDETFRANIINTQRFSLSENWRENIELDTFSLTNYDFITFSSKYTLTKVKHIALSGEVRKPGIYSVKPNMTLKDLLYIAGGPTPDVELEDVELSVYTGSQEDFERKLKNSEPLDKKNTLSRIKMQKDWQNDPTLDTVFLKNYNYVSFSSKYDFLKTKSISIEGAVVRGVSLAQSPTLTLKDLIYAAGGINKEAEVDYIDLYVRMDETEKGNFSIKTDKKELIRIRVDENWKTNPIYDSVKVFPYYKVVVYDQRRFLEQGKIEVTGLVKGAGSFEYTPKMTLKDAIYLAGGIQLESDFGKIEISRVLDIENTNRQIVPVKVKSIMVATDQDWQKDPNLDKIYLLPYDQIFVRVNPDFKLQDGIRIEGEILVPGPYNKAKTEERLSDFVARAGGITKMAFPEGAILNRVGYGEVVIKLDKALRRPGSKFDLVLQKGDALLIPAISEIVTINGNVLKPGSNILFDPAHKKLKYYVDLSGGFAEKTVYRRTTVKYPNGAVKRARRYLFAFHTYPKVTKGCIVEVPKRDEKPETQAANAENRFKLGEKLAEVMSYATSMITLLVLVKAATK